MNRYLSRIHVFGTTVGFCLLAAACGGTGSSTSTADTSGTGSTTSDTLSTGAMDTLTEVPASMGPVVDSTSSNLAKRANVAKLASTGVNLSSLSNSDFTSSSSRAMCEMADMARNTLREASMADRVECYMSTVIADNTAATAALEDAGYHIVALAMPDGMDEADIPTKLKVRVVKDDSGNISDFEMFICDANGQNEYIHKTISDSSFAMEAKGSGTYSYTGDMGALTGQWSHSVAVTANLNSDGDFVGEKVITLGHASTSTGTGLTTSSYGSGSVTQTPDSMTFSGYSGFETNMGGSTSTSTGAIYSVAQLIDGNASDATDYDPTLLAFGDGAAKLQYSNVSSQYGTFSDTITQAWNGDTTAEVSSNEFTSAVASATLVSAGSAPTIAFESDEAYDCSGDVEMTLTITEEMFTTMGSQCETFGDYEQVSCQAVIGGGE